MVVKRYIAILDGSLATESGSIELSFRLDPENRPYQVLDPLNGKSGITLWQ
jgi:tRNA pseudouridine32 synthase/23S rRNA pseudouridine746 synthase